MTGEEERNFCLMDNWSGHIQQTFLQNETAGRRGFDEFYVNVHPLDIYIKK